MKILKKILSAGMAVVTALTATGVLRLPELSLSMALTANAANANGSCGASLIWTLDSGGTLTISGTGKMTNWSNKEAPWYKYRDRVKSVKFSNNVESIGNFAFTDCSYLRNVLIPDSVERIGDYAFGLCQNLNDITILNPNCRIYESSATINNSVNPTISGFDFYGTIYGYEGSTAEVYAKRFGRNFVPLDSTEQTSTNGNVSGQCGAQGDNLTWALDSEGTLTITGMGEMANWNDIKAPWFKYYEEVKSVNLSDGMTSIGDFAFDHCSDLTSITIPDNVTSIGQGAFFGCTGLTSITIPDRVTSIGVGAFNSCEKLADITIPDSVTSIGDNTFNACTSLTSITIPDSVTSIGKGAFSGCRGLENVIIPESVTSIGGCAFNNCVNLTNITILNPNCSIYYSDETICNLNSDSGIRFGGRIYGYEGSTAESYAKTFGKNFVVFSNELIDFGKCDSSLTWTLDNKYTLTIRGTGKMKDWYGEHPPWNKYQDKIQSVKLLNGVTNIGAMAFYKCSKLTSITIPDSVTRIGNEAFYWCSSLTDITILNPDCYIDCMDNDNSKTICNTYDISTQKYIFNGIIYSYSRSSANYYAEKYNLSFVSLDSKTETTTNLTMTSTTTTSTSTKPTTITTTTTSRTITTITSTSTITTTTTLGSVMVSGRFGAQGDNLTWTLYDNGTLFISGTGKMADWAPSVTKEKPPWSSYISQIKEVVIESGVTNVGKYAFDQCTNLITVTISETVAEICEFAFCRCNILKSITFLNPNCIISDKISTICNSLTDVGNSAATYPFKGNIYGYDNSTAETYANKYDRSFISLGEFSENGTTTTTTAITTTATSITNATTPIATTTITSITTTTTPIRNIEQIVYQIGDVTGKAGETIDVPVYVWNDPGTAGLSMKFAVEQGFMIIGWTIGKAYTNLNYSEFSHFSDEALLIWASADGKNQRAASGTIIITLHVAVPQNAKPGIHPISFVTGSTRAVNEQEQLLTFSETNGSITINDEPAVLTNMTTTSITSTTTPTAAMVSTTTTTATSSTNPTYTTKVLVGDVNLDGRISAADAQLTLNYYTSVIVAGNIRFQFDSNDTDDMYRLRLQIADVDGNDWVDLSDSQYILQYYLSQLAELTTQWVNITGVDSQAILDKKISSNTNLTL